MSFTSSTVGFLFFINGFLFAFVGCNLYSSDIRTDMETSLMGEIPEDEDDEEDEVNYLLFRFNVIFFFLLKLKF
jgi:hypothetical protein